VRCVLKPLCVVEEAFTSWVLQLALTSDGGTLLGCSGDSKAVKQWTVREGAMEVRCPLCSDEHGVCILTACTQFARELAKHEEQVGCLALSPDDRLLVTASAEDKSTKLWALPEGTVSGAAACVFALPCSLEWRCPTGCSLWQT
jgi:WD40 repeat protein